MVSNLWAQRNVSYPQLAMRNQQQPISFDFITLPGNTDSTVTFASIFSFPYSYLPFKKNNDRSSENEFFGVVDLSLEVFKADEKEFLKRQKNKDISVAGLEPAERAFWSDTAFAQTYEESQSKKQFLNGFLSTPLRPGIYHYVLQMKRGEETDSQLSRTQSVRIKPYSEMEIGNIILGEEIRVADKMPQLKLSDTGKNVKYAKDFFALAYLPQYDNEANYTLQITSLNVNDEDTSRVNQIYSSDIRDIRTGVKPKIAYSNNELIINLHSSEDGFAYALIKVPNSNFPNSLYRMTIEKEDEKRPTAQTTFRSLWIDMPTSLLNLDVAIDMLHYIVDDETLDQLSRGTRLEREKKFREFWKKRDPTPDSEFNELMAEYYRRIDYAYENFTTDNTLGYESDQGEIYIKFGPPSDINRRFPTNGPTREIWIYENRKFIFSATTGFGDFKLISDESR
jgi:GWxTD domain-containing protein